MMQTKKTKKYECKSKVIKTKGKAEPKATITTTAKSLSTFLDAVESVVPEARVHITETGLRVFMVDAAIVCMINAELACKVSFEGGAPKKVGINIAHLKKLLMHSKGSTVSLVVSESEILVTYSRFSGTCCVVDDICGIRTEPKKEPDMVLNAHFDIPGKYLFETSRVFKGDGKVIFESVGQVMYLTTEGGDITFREVVGTITNVKKEQFRSIFSGGYIHNIAAVVKDTPIHIDVGIDHPVVISTEKDDCKIKYHLAPCIESD